MKMLWLPTINPFSSNYNMHIVDCRKADWLLDEFNKESHTLIALFTLNKKFTAAPGHCPWIVDTLSNYMINLK